MADPTTDAIDRIFDFIDSGVDAADHVLNRGKYTEEQLQKRRPKVIDAESADKPKASAAAPSSSNAVAKHPCLYIKESVDPRSGQTLYVVTDGVNARTECSTREFAVKILRALGGTP